MRYRLEMSFPSGVSTNGTTREALSTGHTMTPPELTKPVGFATRGRRTNSRRPGLLRCHPHGFVHANAFRRLRIDPRIAGDDPEPGVAGLGRIGVAVPSGYLDVSVGTQFFKRCVLRIHYPI